jgi:putative peptidoglycan lipid II flippase
VKLLSWRPWRHSSSTGARGRTVAANAAIVALAFAASRVLGMVREIIIAARFGTGETYDAYIAAFRIPDLLFFIVMSGAFGSAFIPVFGGYLAQGDEERAWRLANTLLTWIVVAFLIVAQLIFLFAPQLVGTVIAPELSAESQELAVNLTRLLLLSPLLLGLGAAAKGMLEAQDAFTLPAIAPILYNLGIIFGAIALAPVFGIYGLAAGVIIGALAHVTIQFASLFRRGLRVRPSFSRHVDGLGEVARLMGPRILGQSASQVNLIVMVNFASRLGEGSISSLSYAQHLVLLPHGILAMSLSTVIFPRMAREFATGDVDALRRTLANGLGPLVFLTLPAAICLFVFRTSIVQVVFQYGSFSAESTALVAEAVGFFAVGLLARALIEPITRAFYAMHDTRTPVIVAIVMILANIGLSWLLAPRLGHGGLALSLSITYTIRMVVVLAILSGRTGGVARDLAVSIRRMAPPAAILTGVSLAIMQPLVRVTDPNNGRTVIDYSLFALALVVASGVYLLASWLLRLPEFYRFVNIVQHRVSRAE